MRPPPVRFATSPDGGKIGYQTLGDGPIDLVLITSLNPNIDVLWEHPKLEQFHRRLASFSRLIVYNQRGTGISDPAPPNRGITIEEHAADLLTVLNTAQVERAALMSADNGSFPPLLFAASYPDRVQGLAILDGVATYRRHEDYPAGFPEPALQRLIESSVAQFGSGGALEWLAPELFGDERFRDYYAKLERTSVAPSSIETQTRHTMTQFDLRAILPLIKAPTLVIAHTEHAFLRTGHGRYIAERIPGAKFVEREGFAGLYWIHDVDWVLDEVQNFLTGARGTVDLDDRVLATVLFTDIVGSTAKVAELGDRRWRELLDQHDAVVHREIERFRGRAVVSTGDGILATFDGPARAIRCALSINDAMRPLGIEIRTGLHTGEVEKVGDDVRGIAVHIAARVMAEADGGSVLVSGSVPPLVAGSGLTFADRGAHVLKGVPGEWRLYAVET